MGVGLYPPPNNDTGWVSFSGVATYSNNFVFNTGSYRKYGNRIAISAVALLPKGATTADDPPSIGPTTSTGTHSGNLAGDPVLLTMPVGFRPAATQVITLDASFGTWTGRLVAGGTLAIYDGPPGATIAPGEFVTWSADYILAGM
ncbi:hypothetical protein [Streptomyces phage Vanseggelen]|uniref:Uncharacterized protein n=1 Tax=Streptomyces phage Vanseggelen TaxID=3065246 RepID=A0AA50F1E3_9CAUD|nr:hypothetical protein [Streptomyces phage Vanseggelen]